MDAYDLRQALKRTDSLGNVSYSLYLPTDEPLTLTNLCLYLIDDRITGRILKYQVDREWLQKEGGFPGWDSFTGTFRAFDLDEQLLY